MKVLSLLQPWASLCAMGHKTVETRPWNTKYRGPLLIHASLGKHFGKGPTRISCRELCYQSPFRDFIPATEFDKLPFGAIVGQVELPETFQFGSDEAIEYMRGKDVKLLQQELAFGDWTEGRYGFVLINPQQFDQPIPAKGQLNLWEFDWNKHQ